MTTPDTPAPPGSRLLWALRFHSRALSAAAALLLLLTALAVARLVLAPPTYTATAAVIATDLEFSAERVPRLAEAIYRQDSVLADAIRRGQLPWSVDVLRDEHAKLIPLEDNVLVIVEGTAQRPGLAVRTANSVATALAVALQRSGTAATFSVQERAVRAVQDPIWIPLGVTVVAGLLATAAAVLGLAGLLLAMRRPVTRVSEAAQLTGAPVLTVVDVPRRGRPAWPLSGVPALQRALQARGAATVVLTTTPGGGQVRTAVAENYAHLLGLHKDATLVPYPGAQIPPALLDESRVLIRHRGSAATGDADSDATVVDGFEDESATWRQSLTPGALGVIVIVEGARHDDVAAAVARFVPEDLAGVVFAARRGRGRGRDAADGSAPAAATATSPDLKATSVIPEKEPPATNPAVEPDAAGSHPVGEPGPTGPAPTGAERPAVEGPRA